MSGEKLTAFVWTREAAERDEHLYVVKRGKYDDKTHMYGSDGRHQKVCCEKISIRLERLCYGLHRDFIDIVRD